MISAAPTDYDPQILYKQFLNYMKGGQKKQIEQQIENDYKKLYSQLCKSNQQRRNNLASTSNKEFNMRTTGCKFTKLQGYQQLNNLKNSFVMCESRMAVQIDKENLQDQILLEQTQKKQLQEDIDQYKISLSRLRKQIAKIKAEIKVVDLKQNKFQQAQHLASNILQFVDQNSIINCRNYNKMLEEQQSVVTKLKKMRNVVKNQLNQTQQLYQSQQKQHEVKYKKMVKSFIPLQEYESNQKKCPKMPKGFKKYLQSIESVLNMLAQKQQSYQTLKLQQCTKILPKKLNKDIFTADESDWLNLIQQFQQNFQIRLQSIDKIIIKLYHKLKQSNQSVEKKIFEQKCLIQDYEEQYKYLQDKKGISEQNYEQLNRKLCENKVWKKKEKFVHTNSILFIQVIELVNSLLIKFKYVFKLFIMLNIDKRRLSDQILRLDQVLDYKSAFMGCKLNDASNPNGTQSSEDTNAIEMYQVFASKFQGIDFQHIKQMIDLFFNDIRAALIWRRAMVLQQIQQCKKENKEEELIKVLSTIRDECQYSYNEKLKNSFNILFDCFKSSIKAGNNNLASSAKNYATKNKNKLFHSEFVFMTPKIGVIIKQLEQQQNSNAGLQQIVWREDEGLKVTERTKKPQIQAWGEDEKRNPNSMIRKLAAIRNESSKKMKVLNLHEPQRKYIKLDMGLQLQKLSPKLITTSSQCKSAQTQKSNQSSSEAVSLRNKKRNSKSINKTTQNAATHFSKQTSLVY